jgi:hypothetical protein
MTTSMQREQSAKKPKKKKKKKKKAVWREIKWAKKWVNGRNQAGAQYLVLLGCEWRVLKN